MVMNSHSCAEYPGMGSVWQIHFLSFYLMHASRNKIAKTKQEILVGEQLTEATESLSNRFAYNFINLCAKVLCCTAFGFNLVLYLVCITATELYLRVARRF